MTIVSSITEADPFLQANGERMIRHRMTDHLGKTHYTYFKRVPGAWGATEFDADRAVAVVDKETELAEAEAWSLINA